MNIHEHNFLNELGNLISYEFSRDDCDWFFFSICEINKSEAK